MSAVVQELYPSLPVTLLTELAALSDPKTVLDVTPEASAFVLSCAGGGLPSEHQRSHELKLCSQESDERLVCTDTAPCAGLTELLSKVPAESRGLAEDTEAQRKNLMKQHCLNGCLKEDACAAKDTSDVAEEGHLECSLALKETCWSKQEKPRLIQEEERECLSRSSCAEIIGSLQNLEESQTNVQVAIENPPKPMKEAQGMAAAGSGLCSSARESRGFEPESWEYPKIDPVTANCEVSETNTLISLKPLRGPEEQQQEECEGASTCTSLSAGGENVCSQDEVNNNSLPSQPNKENVHAHDPSESRAAIDNQLSSICSEASNCPTEGSLELGTALWNKNEDVFEVVCETQEECSAPDVESLGSDSRCERIEFLEAWAYQEAPLLTKGCEVSTEELFRDSSDQEVGVCTEHSYCCVSEEAAKRHRDAQQYGLKAIPGKSQSGNFAASNSIGLTAEEEIQATASKNIQEMQPRNSSSFLNVLYSASEEYSEDMLRPALSGNDGIPKDANLQCDLPSAGSLVEENKPVLVEANKSISRKDTLGWLQNSCSTSMNLLPSCHDSLDFGNKGCEEQLLWAPANSSSRTEIPKSASATCLHAADPSCTIDVNLVTNDENIKPTPFYQQHPFVQKTDWVLDSSSFLDNLSREELLGACAKLEMQNAGRLLHNWKELSSTKQTGGSYPTASEAFQNNSASQLNGAGIRVAAMETAQGKGCGHSDQRRNNVRSDVDAHCTVLGSICLDGDVLKANSSTLRTEADTEEVDRLEMCRSPVSPSWECNGETGDAASHCAGSEAAESKWDSVCPVSRLSNGFSKAEPSESNEKMLEQKTEGEGDDHRVNAEEDLDGNMIVYPPGRNTEHKWIKTSWEVDSDGMEKAESVKMYDDELRSGKSKKPTCGRDLDKAIPPFEVGRHIKDHNKEELEQSEIHFSSSLPDHSSLSSDPQDHVKQEKHSVYLENLYPKGFGQPRETLSQMDIQAFVGQNHHLDKIECFSQDNETLESEVLTCQQHLFSTSDKQVSDNAMQTVTCSAEETQKPFYRDRNASLCPKSVADTIMSAPVLLAENGMEETLQRNREGYDSMNKTGPESGESIELQHAEMPLERLENASERLKLNGLNGMDQDPHKGNSELHSVSQSVNRSPLDVLGKNCILTMNYQPASSSNQNSFQLEPTTSSVAYGQKTLEGLHSKLCKDHELLSITHIPLEIQLAQNEPPASLSPDVFCSPPAKEYLTVTVSLERQADSHINTLVSAGKKSSRSVKEDAYRGSPPENKEMSRNTVANKQGGVLIRETGPVTSNSTDPAKMFNLSTEDNKGKSSLAAEKMKLPVHSFSNAKNSSGVPLQDLKFPFGEEEMSVPYKGEIQGSLHFAHLPRHVLEVGLSKGLAYAKDLSNRGIMKWNSQNIGQALQSKVFSPSSPPRNICSCKPYASLGASVLKASPKRFRNKTSLLSAKNRQEQVGNPTKLWSHSISKGKTTLANKARASARANGSTFLQRTMQGETEKNPARYVTFRDAVRTGSLLTQRMPVVGHPSADTANELRALSVTKPQGSPEQPSVVQSTVKGRENPCSTLKRLKRPKEPEGLFGWISLEAMSRSPSFSFRNCCQTSANNAMSAASLSCTFPQGLGSNRLRGAHKIRQLLPLRRQAGRTCKKLFFQGLFKVMSKRRLLKNSAFLNNPAKIVLEHEPQFINYTCLATKPAKAIENKMALIQNQMPQSTAAQSSFRLSQCTKESKLLRRLAVVADKLLSPSRNPQKLEPLLHSTDLSPVTHKYGLHRSKKLLDVFSCVNLNLNSQWVSNDSCYVKMLSSQFLALYPVESTNLFFLELSNKAHLAFSAPLLLHVQMDSTATRNFLEIMSVESGSNRGALTEVHTLQSSEWIFFFLLSQSFLGIAPTHEGVRVPIKSSATSAPFAAEKDRRHVTVAKQLSCSLLGFHTMLALSSPGCYRVWTRKRHLTSRIPTIQRLMLLQFIQGLKGLKSSTSVSADLFTSFPHLLGRVLSIWSQHGPSTCSSEFTPLHSDCCKWQPVATAASHLSLCNRLFFRLGQDCLLYGQQFENSQAGSVERGGPCLAYKRRSTCETSHIGGNQDFDTFLQTESDSGLLPQVPDQVVEVSRAAQDDVRLAPFFSVSLPTSCSIPEQALSSFGFSVPEFQVRPLDEVDVSVPVLPKTDAQLEKVESEKKPRKVSQIRIRKTIPKPDPNLTPMGLPRPKRLKKTEFSLEEIYTNKNYKSPPTTRCLETIFEEPKEKNGSLVSVSQQKRKRILEFQDFTIPRKRKARSRVKVMGTFTRAQKAALGGRELDALLVQKLTDLESFFAKVEEREQEQASGS